MNILFNVAIWLVSRTTIGCYAIMGESLAPAVIVMILLALLLAGGIGWLILTWLGLKGLIGFGIGMLVTVVMYPRMRS